MKKLFLIMIGISSILSVESMAQQQTQEENFKYILDEFADCKVMRYQLPDWDSLTLKQKQYIYCLSEATLWGRDIYFDQNYKHNLLIRKALEYILNNYKGEKNTKEYKDFEVYAKRFFFSNGMHHHYGEKKFYPDCSKSYFSSLLDNYKDKEFILEQIYNENIAPIRRDNSTDKDIVKTSAVNFYENISRQE
ncbi:MAG: dihydrofolate reductase, partial [Bacteroidota bacterium]|nr:dihydrofolate reductase [Bacteroidota bacterium]